MDTASIYGRMVKNTMEGDRIIKCMEWGRQSGQTAGSIVGSTLRIKSKAMALLSGRMARNILAIGFKANNMAKVSMSMSVELREREFGRMAKGFNGLNEFYNSF